MRISTAAKHIGIIKLNTLKSRKTTIFYKTLLSDKEFKGRGVFRNLSRGGLKKFLYMGPVNPLKSIVQGGLSPHSPPPAYAIVQGYFCEFGIATFAWRVTRNTLLFPLKGSIITKIY